jgi:putative tricarboxylic transport membrane protein
MVKNRKDFTSSLFLLAIGLFLFFQSKKLLVWSRFGPEEGFFPLAIAIIIIGISLVILIHSVAFSPAPAQGKQKVLTSKTEERRDLFRVSSYGILTLLYGSLMESAGFLVSTAVFLFLILKFAEGKSWRVTVVVAFTAITVSYVLFKYWLGVPLPPGVMKGWDIF